MKLSDQGGGIFNLKELFAHKTSGIHRNGSPFPIDRVTVADEAFDNLRKKTILIDGVFKGDYSLAIVNRQVARALIAAGLNVRVFTREEGWKTDPLLGEMSDVRSRCLEAYPEPASYDIHLRNTWPPAADDMVGRLINAYVCFAWEETAFPPGLVSHFNTYLDLVMVTANFVAESLVNSGVRIPVVTVGNGTDHILKVVRQALAPALQRGPRERILHVSSCFPRKGADALVKAFSATFTRDDNVELFIKTFDNPHNRIDRIVTAAHAAHPEMAPVRVVKQSLASGELAELVRTASLFVAPSRGEGFGLPLAEATLLGVPVVTTNFSGQTDFCTDETAWLVDYQLRPSDAHVTSGGVWADPDIGSLRTQMRAALASHALAEEKVARGQALLTSHFKWSDVARRVAVSVAGVIAEKATSATAALPPLRVDLVSTWNQVCGIATYSEHLFSTGALSVALHHVMARELRSDGTAPVNGATHPGVEVTRPWGYDAAGIARLAAEVRAGHADVLWFQHHPGFFSDGDMATLTEAMKGGSYGARAITLHNVRETLQGGRGQWLGSFDTLFVHTEADARLIGERGGLIATLVPHGILAAAPREKTHNGFTIGTFGFLYPHKNVPLLVEAVARARAIVPDLRLSITTSVRRDPVSMIERVRVEALIADLGLDDVVDADFRFLDDEAVFDRLGQCDLLCFPYGESTESATGAGRIALSADRPILCSRSSVMTDILPYSLVLERTDVECLAEAIVLLSASDGLLHLRDGARHAFVGRNSYDAVAQRYTTVLHRTLKGSKYA